MKHAMFALILVGGSVSAQPSPIVNWLMDEPASLFDIGMLRLRQENIERWIPRLSDRLAELLLLGKGESLDSSSVVYDIEQNKINISVMFKGNPDESRCARILGEYKDAISPLRSKSPDFSAVLFAGSFDHVNYSIRGAPANWHREIVGIVRVTVGIEESLRPTERNAGADYKALRALAGGRTIFCAGGLVTDDVAYTKQGF